MNKIDFSLSIVLFLGLLMNSCTEEHGLRIDRTNVPIHSLKGSLLKNDSVLYSSSICVLENNYIASVVYGTGKLIHLFQIRGDSLIFVDDFLENGNGPLEMGVPDMAYDRNNHQLILKDANKQSALFLNIANEANITNTDTWGVVNRLVPDFSFSFNNFIVQSDSTLLSLTIKDGIKSFLAVINFKEQRCYPLAGFWPEDGFQGNDLIKQVEYTLWGAQLLKHPSRNRYFYSSEFGYFAEYFSIQDSMVVDRKKLYDVYPVYSSKDDMNATQSPETGLGMRAYGTNSHVYISLNRGTHEECIQQLQAGYKPSEYYGCNTEILVYDWEGCLKSIYQLDIPVRSFYVSDNDDKIIAMTQDDDSGEYRVVCFDIL